jgi:hypothetical protein
MLFLYLTMGYILSICFWTKPLIKNVTIEFRKKESLLSEDSGIVACGSESNGKEQYHWG